MALPRFEEQIKELVDLFTAVKDTLTQLLRRVFGGQVDPEEAAPVATELLSDLLEETAQWVAETIPQVYAAGAKHAADEMGEGTAGVSARISDRHDDVVDLLMEDVLEDMDASISEVDKQTQARLREKQRRDHIQQLTQGDVDLERPREDDEPYFRDRAGREWPFDRYADQKLRDWITDTLNTGAANTALEMGSPGVKIFDGHGTDTDEPCRRAHGEVWSAAYFLANLKEHPNCQRRGDALPRDWVGTIDRE